LADARQDAKEAPLPEDIRTYVNDTLADGSEAFAHEEVQNHLPAEVEDEA